MVRWSRELIRGLELVSEPETLSIDVVIRGQMDFARMTVEQYGLQCRLHAVPVRSRSTRERIESVRRVSAVVAALRPDVVHVPMGSIWLLAPPKAHRSAVVVTAHGLPSRALVPLHGRLVARQLVRTGCATLLANSERLRAPLDQLVGVSSGTALALPVGTDPLPDDEADGDRRLLRESLGAAPDERIVSVVGRLVPGKRVDLVLDVADRMRRTGWSVRFIVCGDGPERASLTAATELRGLSDCIHFVGHVSDPGGFLLGSDAVLHPSDSEGAPFTVIESLLAGTPVVATDVGGVPDLVTSDLEGQLAARGDVEGLFRRLTEVFEEPDRRAERAELARRRFSLEGMGRAHLGLIERLVGQV